MLEILTLVEISWIEFRLLTGSWLGLIIKFRDLVVDVSNLDQCVTTLSHYMTVGNNRYTCYHSLVFFDHMSCFDFLTRRLNVCFSLYSHRRPFSLCLSLSLDNCWEWRVLPTWLKTSTQGILERYKKLMYRKMNFIIFI